MRTRAALVRAAGKPFEVAEVELDAPRQGEIQVKMAASGLCHSDDHLQTGDTITGHYPIIGGHEGAGVVEQVGPSTPGWSVGDHVVFSFVASCGRCRWCAEGRTNLCDLGRFSLTGSRYDDPGSYRFALDGAAVGQLCGVGSFAERTVVSVDSAIKVADDLPLDKICLLGCAVGTGWGSAVYAAEVRPGDVTIVQGAGGVGINAVQGAAHAGAEAVIAVDPVEFKRETAIRLGATVAFADMADAADFARSLTNGQGADQAIVTVGVVRGEHVAQAFGSIRKAGTVVVTGMAPSDDAGGIPVSTRELTLLQKRLQGSLFGHCNPMADIPRQIGMYRSGALNLDDLITRTYGLDELRAGYRDLHDGLNLRGVILFD
ncbi:NDMA-dependent alcohol dehydrogenase [Amycolatopsis acidicola]|uniref:NDMA-dependent alcohol dehydrogenase n=1 Tax=Amycolatopsis acidicola TaxID=2596893 RepID=A0A5N0VAB6_9PSEU|nr:NDMA-dependent alcohol dehydrogenase [Amycolatopsis acidicola]KAA9163327.1 NDMA-dependent alcohol dehydrogenase [Amycolatopsis acidicola]